MDQGHIETEKLLVALESKIKKVYGEASKDIQKKADAYFAGFIERDKKQQELLKAGKITEEQYKQWRLAQMGRGERFIALRDDLAKRMNEANKVAVSYINDETPSIYSLNHNYAAYEIEQVAGNVGFTLYDEQTVRRLIAEDPTLLPKRRVDAPKDLKWNKKRFTAEITAGILSGESIGKLANRVQNLSDANRSGAIRNARTAVTGAQNAGRQESYNRAKKMGLKLSKRWIATKDNRTRHEHAMLDGQTVPLDKPFQIDGHKLMFPGDPTGLARLVWNCRCTMRTAEKEGIEAEPRQMRVRNASGELELVNEMTYSEWTEWKKTGVQPSAKTSAGKFKEIKNALDFGYGDFTNDDYNKWWDAYEAHNKGVKLSAEELRYIEEYTEGSFIAFNDVSRFSDAELLKKGYSVEDIARIRKKADVLEGALSKYDLDTDIVTHRFERDVSWLTGTGNGIEGLEKLIGTEYTTEGFTSSGMLPNRARFSGGKNDAVHFEIVTPKGTNGAFLSMSKKGENEFLYNRNTRYRVLDGGERVVKEQKLNFKTWQVEEVEVTERFLKVQVIPGTVVKSVAKASVANAIDGASDVVKAVSKKTAKAVKKPAFSMAKTIQEAETFANQFVDAKGFGAIGTSYAGVHLDVANAVNHALSDVFNLFDIPKLGGIAAPAKNTKLGKMVNAHAAYQPIRKSILMDRNKTKNVKTMLGGLMADKTAVNDILAHPERYDFDKLSNRILKVINASKETGRSIVAETIQEAITHELGHHIERNISKQDWDVIKNGMDKYATKISGYCVDSPSEYFAESFTSYMKGENRIDPALRAIFDKMRR